MPVKEARIKAAEAKTGTLVPQKDAIKFGEITAEWLKKKMSGKKDSYLHTIRLRLKNYILPEFENLSLEEITSGQILKLCRKLEDRGTIETAARVKTLIGQIFRYAIATDRTESDPTIALRNALASRQPKHMAALTKPADIAMLMRNISAYPRVVVRCALKFSALTFCRPGEIRQAEWSEIDFENREWRIESGGFRQER